MDWIQRLNRGPGRIALGGTIAEVLRWAYSPHLADNVPHRHTFFEICQVGAYGRGHFLVEQRPFEVKPGDVFIARPGVVHQIVNRERPQMELFWVSFTWTPGTDEERGEEDALLRAFAQGSVLVAGDDHAHVRALWNALRAIAQTSPSPGYAAQIAGLTAALLLAIAQTGAGPHKGEGVEPAGPETGASLARLAVRYVQDNLHRPLGVAEVAAHLHLSPRHLSRLFVRFTGTSPAAYVEHARMDRACALLRHGDTPIKEIAANVGYNTVHHFTRVFSRRFGCPPGAFRADPGRCVPQSLIPGGLR